MATQEDKDNQQEAFENFREEFNLLLTRHNLDFEGADAAVVIFRDDRDKTEYDL